jgi:hypothetical protein
MVVRQSFSFGIDVGEMIFMKVSSSKLLSDLHVNSSTSKPIYEFVICVSKEPTNMILCYIIELFNSTEPCLIESNFGMWLGGNS